MIRLKSSLLTQKDQKLLLSAIPAHLMICSTFTILETLKLNYASENK